MILTVEKAHSALDVSKELRRRGIDALQVRFAHQTVFVLTGSKNRVEDRQALATLAGVERVTDASEPYQLVHRSFCPDGTQVDLGGGVAIGRGRFAVIADMDSEMEASDLLRTAQGLVRGRVAALIAILPDGEGLSAGKRKRAAMGTLEQIRSATGLRVGIEVATEGDLDELAGAAGKPVVLVRALSATLEEWLLAAEYMAATGNDQVILCERGIRSFTPETGRVTLDLASVARLSEMTHLPVIVDLLRSYERPSLAARLARAAVAAGADGVVFPLSWGARAEGLSDLLASIDPALTTEGKRLNSAGSADRQPNAVA